MGLIVIVYQCDEVQGTVLLPEKGIWHITCMVRNSVLPVSLKDTLIKLCRKVKGKTWHAPLQIHDAPS